ncbi:sensor histidine kinase [Actinoplanes subtropicus]|uniref:sensor histidine kinase n=1 Tax=Actinoplanes subtropicus TaxID=543632 RepID=UPI0004C3FFB9|nr:nitrate- and nitrite sensing domain-containing protein [Actinoplanes subtropicus]
MRRAGLLIVALWLAAAVPAVLGAADRVRERATDDRLGRAVDTAVVAAQDERRLSVAFLAGGDAAGLGAARERTDRAREALRTLTGRWVYTASAAALVSAFDGLGPVRSQVDGRAIGRSAVLSAYGAIIAAGVGLPWLPAGPPGRAREALSEEDALLRAALSTSSGLTDAERVRVGELAGERGTGSPAASEQWLAAVEARVILGKDTRVSPAEWAAAAAPVNAGLRAAETRAAHDAVTRATPGAIRATVYAGLIAGVGLVAVIGVLVLARRFRPGLPSRRAEPPARDDAPVDLQPLLLDLHRRSQRLLHRLLRLLDGLERRESDEEKLGRLFRADHLATRVRRNVEKAVTLAGGPSARQWRRPVPVGEVVRGAAAEVEDYVRVSTAQIEPAALVGDAVLEITHLLAELIDNAVAFSPAETRVRAGGHWTDGGYTVTVADAGPGMSDLDLDQARQVMSAAGPPEGGMWLGFYAVGRFAARWGAEVGLRRGPAGGLVAEVRLPAGLVSRPAPDGPPDGPPINRVERMRARVGKMSDLADTSVDLSNVGSPRPDGTEAQ